MSAGEWHNDIHAVGVALKLNDGTGPYAFNCGAPAFKFSEVLLKNDIGPRLVAMVRNIEVAMTGTIGRGVQGKEPGLKKLKQTGERQHALQRGSGSAFNCMQRHLLRAAGALARNPFIVL
jgi:hypothetical protein